MKAVLISLFLLAVLITTSVAKSDDCSFHHTLEVSYDFEKSELDSDFSLHTAAIIAKKHQKDTRISKQYSFSLTQSTQTLYRPPRNLT